MPWNNFFVYSLGATTREGHLQSEMLRTAIKQHDGREAYHCAFDLEPREDFKDYVGAATPALGYAWVDFDAKPGVYTVEDAHTDAKAFTQFLGVQDVFTCYSGSKGFHVGVPFSYFGLATDNHTCRHLHSLALQLKAQFKTLDTTIYNPGRKFRVLGSKHPKTGLYKRHVELHLPLPEIKQLASSRGPLDIPVPADNGVLSQLKLQPVAVPARKKSADKEWEPPSGEGALKHCGFLQHARDNAATLAEPPWYAMISVVSRFANGRQQCHAMSARHPGYSAPSCNDKINQALSEAGPATCAQIDTLWDGCKACPLYGKIHSPVNIPSDEEKKKFKEYPVAQALIEKAQGNLIRQDKSIFRYSDGFWKEMTPTEIDSFKQKIMLFYNGAVTSKQVDSTFKTFFRALPPVPSEINLFDPQPFCVNFQNGTLHIRQSKDFEYSTEFLPHKREDWLNTVLPFDYDEKNTEKNTPFLEMLDRVFQGDDDREEKIRAVRQMFGACLIPTFPRLFFLFGPTGCGKSTVLQVAAKFVSDANISSVDPSNFHGFGMENMIGKLVNVVTDVETKKPISDSQIKMIIDRRKVQIQRKGITNILGMLPAVHLFGGNKIPPTLEGELGAHARRWTFIQFKHVQTHGLYNKEFHHWVFDQSPMGVLNFALEGLRDLLAQRGHYLVPESGKAKMKEWQSQEDVVEHFLEDARNGDIVEHIAGSPLLILKVGSKLKINRVNLFEFFEKWATQSGHHFTPMSRQKFNSALIEKKFGMHPSDGVRYVLGIGLVTPEETDF